MKLLNSGSVSWQGWRRVMAGCVLIVAAALIAIRMGNTQLAFFSVLGCLAVTSFVAFSDWRAGVLLLIAWLTVEDLIRKYMGNNMVIYFFKDIIYLVTLFAFTLASFRRGRQPFNPPFLKPLVSFLIFAAVQTFNPNTPSPLYGLLGFRMNFFYLPLLWVGFHVWEMPPDLGRFWVFCLTVGTAVAVLGIIQGIVGLDFLNPPTLAEEIRPLAYLIREAPISGYKVPRPCSVFVSDGRFGHFMLLCLTLGLGMSIALWLTPLWRNWLSRWQQGAILIGTGVCAAALFMVGSRGGFVFGSLTVLVLLLINRWQTTLQYVRRQWRKALPIVSVALGVAFLVVTVIAPEALKARWAFYWETLSPWSPRSELFDRIFRYHPQNFMGAFLSPYALFGQGFGTNSLGIQYLRKFTDVLLPFVIVESGLGNIVAEVGIIGLMLWLLWCFSVTIWAWQLTFQLRDTPFASIAACIAWYATVKVLGPLWGGMAGFQEFIGNAFLWLLLGILGRLPYLTENEGSKNSAATRTYQRRGKE